MREVVFTVTKNEEIAKNIYRMLLAGDTSDITKPGQFVNIKIPSQYLRRPISVCDWKNGELTIIYKVIGDGTKELSKITIGFELSILSGLGNGYELYKNSPVLIGGGVGVPPLYGLAKKFLEQNIKPRIILGFNRSEECFYIKEFQSLGLNVEVATLDGSYGIKGLVTDIFEDQCEYAYVCGPSAMLKAVYKKIKDGQFSFEARMGCGFGVCMGCSIKTQSGYKRICKDGPVFRYSDIIWEN